jgi:hypothetical protein
MRTTDEPIIEVKHLAKRYRIGLDRTYKTFCESAVNVMKSPVQALRKLRQRTCVKSERVSEGIWLRLPAVNGTVG